MALLYKDKSGDWVFKHGKHAGETLSSVAEGEKNKGYIRWVFHEAAEDLDDEAFYALEDAMEQNGIVP